jgi:hypothetical protein
MWSRIKKAAKWVANKARAVARFLVKLLPAVVTRVINIFGSALDPIYRVKKKMRIQVVILRESAANGLVPEADLLPAINMAKKVFLAECNVEIRAYGDPIVRTVPDVAPDYALDVNCDGGAFIDEAGETGAYFAEKVARWVPISLRFPVTVLVVRSIVGKIGCSIPIADYVTLSATPLTPGGLTGVKSVTTMAHELGHTCLLLDRDNTANLMYGEAKRGTRLTAWQRWAVRTSRHCTYW